jgi:hypothetical protein
MDFSKKNLEKKVEFLVNDFAGKINIREQCKANPN